MDSDLFDLTPATAAARRMRRRRLARGRWVDAVSLPELDGLHLDVRVPGDTPAEPAKGDEMALAMTYWRRDGTVIGQLNTSNPEEMNRVRRELAIVERDPWLRKIGRDLRYRGGARLIISTFFLNTDQSFGAFPTPLLWETKVFRAYRQYRGLGDDVHSMRYASREAALLGHRRIVHAITEASRVLRERHG